MPGGLQTAWDLTLRSDIRKQLSNGHTDLEHLKALIQEAQPRGTEVLNADISYAAKSRMERLMQKIAEKPDDVNQVKELEEIAALMMPLADRVESCGSAEYLLESEADRVAGIPAARDCRGCAAQESVKELLALGEKLSFAPHALELKYVARASCPCELCESHGHCCAGCHAE